MGQLLIAHAVMAYVSKYMRLETAYTTEATCQAGKERKPKSIPPQGMILNTEKHHLWGTMGELQHCENECIHREMCVCVCMRE